MIAAKAEPYEFEFDPATTALVMIDFQRDFVYPGGFGESLGNDTSFLLDGPSRRPSACSRPAAPPGCSSSTPARAIAADLSDLPAAKYERGQPELHIGDPGPMGRLLVRGEHGHDIVDEVYPIEGEPVVDKPGKGAFYATDLDTILKIRGIRSSSSAASRPRSASRPACARRTTAATTPSCSSDAVGSYFPEFQRVALEMIKAQGGIFGWVGDVGRASSTRWGPSSRTPWPARDAGRKRVMPIADCRDRLHGAIVRGPRHGPQEGGSSPRDDQ